MLHLEAKVTLPAVNVCCADPVLSHRVVFQLDLNTCTIKDLTFKGSFEVPQLDSAPLLLHCLPPHSVTRWLTHSLAQSLCASLSRWLSHSLAQSLTSSVTQSPCVLLFICCLHRLESILVHNSVHNPTTLVVTHEPFMATSSVLMYRVADFSRKERLRPCEYSQLC